MAGPSLLQDENARLLLGCAIVRAEQLWQRQQPDVPLALAGVHRPGLDFTADVSYFLGRETLLPTDRPGMSLWRERLFVWMSRNAQTATYFFRLPPERVMEVGVQVEL